MNEINKDDEVKDLFISTPVEKISELVSQETIAAQLPAEQKFTAKNNQDLINSLKSSQKTFEKKSVHEIIKKVGIADDAFLNSILSYCIYTEKLWTIHEIGNQIKSVVPRIQEALFNTKKMYDIKIWHFNNYFFEKIPDHHLKIGSVGSKMTSYGFMSHYKFKDGQFSACNDLAHACVLKSKHPSGEGHVLHLVFRGTEFTRLPAFISKAYLDMNAYYEHFAPLQKAVQEYCKDSANNIKEIQVSGHSLGGSMVQEFLKRNPPAEDMPPIQGFTFGSPGAKKSKILKFVTSTYHNVFHYKIDRKEVKAQEKLDDNDLKDERLHEFYHSNDPIPKIGMTIYSKRGEQHNLFDDLHDLENKVDPSEKNFFEKIPYFGAAVTFFKQKINTQLKNFQTKFHDSGRYIVNLKSLVEDHYREYPYLSKSFNETVNYWQEFLYSENNFKSLTIKYRAVFESFLKEKEPNLEPSAISERVLKLREIMKYDNELLVQASRMATKEVGGVDEFLSQFLHNKPQVSEEIKNTFDYISKENKQTAQIISLESTHERIVKLRAKHLEQNERKVLAFKKMMDGS